MKDEIVTVEGYWLDEPDWKRTVNVSLGSWDGAEDAKDEGIFYYMDGEPLRVGDSISMSFIVTAIEGESK
jgi:hypothetical protein